MIYELLKSNEVVQLNIVGKRLSLHRELEYAQQLDF